MAFLIVGVAALGNKEIIGVLPVVIGLFIVVLMTFSIVPMEMPTGLPKAGSALPPGDYKVAFVYVAGQNVNVGIEMKDDYNECLYLYQFPKIAFDDSIKIKGDSMRLVIVESNGFKKPVLR